MNTFLPYEQYDLSALILDNKTLNKQRENCVEIINILTVKRSEAYGKNKKEYIERTGTVVPYSRHPSVLIWKENVYELIMYTKAICSEWKRRGNKEARWERVQKTLNKLKLYIPFVNCNEPSWLGDRRFHLSHQSNLVRLKPDHYSKLFNVPDDLPYWWPDQII